MTIGWKSCRRWIANVPPTFLRRWIPATPRTSSPSFPLIKPNFFSRKWSRERRKVFAV